MTKYISEIKNRFFLLSLTCISVVSVSYFYKEILLFLIIEPDTLNKFNTTLPLCYFIFTDVLEIFSVYIHLIVFLNLQILLFHFLYHVFIFFSPGFFYFEYIFFNLILKIFITIWGLSVLISKLFLIPLTWNFFLSFQTLSVVTLHFEAKLGEYLDFYFSFYYLCIFYSQSLTLLLVLLNYQKINSLLIKKFRKLNYYFGVIFSTLVSPPEVITQIIISLILILLYEFFTYCFIFKMFLNSLIRQPIKTN